MIQVRIYFYLLLYANIWIYPQSWNKYGILK